MSIIILSAVTQTSSVDSGGGFSVASMVMMMIFITHSCLMLACGTVLRTMAITLRNE